MKLSKQSLKSLDRIEQLLEKHLQGQHNQMSHGGGGGASPDTGGNTSGGGGLGGSPGGKESYSDRIEGTQKEADREVARADKAVAKAKAALKEAQSKLDSVSKPPDFFKAANARLAELAVIKTDLSAKLQASKDRIAALKAQLKPLSAGRTARARRSGKSAEQDVAKEIDRELDILAKLTKDMSAVADGCEKIAAELEKL